MKTLYQFILCLIVSFSLAFFGYTFIDWQFYAIGAPLILILSFLLDLKTKK